MRAHTWAILICTCVYFHVWAFYSLIRLRMVFFFYFCCSISGTFIACILNVKWSPANAINYLKYENVARNLMHFDQDCFPHDYQRLWCWGVAVVVITDFCCFSPLLLVFVGFFFSIHIINHDSNGRKKKKIEINTNTDTHCGYRVISKTNRRNTRRTALCNLA